MNIQAIKLEAEQAANQADFKEMTMSSNVLIENLKAKISLLADDDLEAKFELYRDLRSRSVRDEIYLELLAQAMDERECNSKEYA
jgi:hypothetical protein